MDCITINTYLLYLFIQKIDEQEPALVKIIEEYTIKYYKFNSNEELKNAVNRWCDEDTKEECLNTYGHISNWNTSKITDMYGLFFCKYYFRSWKIIFY